MNQKAAIATLIGSTLGSLILGCLLTYGINFDSISTMSMLKRNSVVQDEYVMDYIAETINKESLMKYLRVLASNSIETGKNEAQIRAWIRSFFNEKVDQVSDSMYQVLASQNSYGLTNKVELIFEGSVRETSQQEAFPYAAYSKSGTVTGNDAIFVNYGALEDFIHVRQEGIIIRERIVIAKLGHVEVGQMVKNAELFEAKGMILFPDEDPGFGRSSSSSSFFQSSGDRWMGGGSSGNTDYEKAVPMVTTKLGSGDPLTPGWPALQDAMRINRGDAYMLPKIIVQAVSHQFGLRIIHSLNGKPCPSGWELSGCKLGGQGFATGSNMDSIRIETSNELKMINVNNVVGVFRGEVEPDRYVIIGNHYDSMSYGAINPSTATAALVHLAEVFAEVMERTGWRPRRTLVFALWGGGQYGDIGSTEWVEEHFPKIRNRAVAYVNSDFCTAGTVLRSTASIPLKKVIEEAMKYVTDPEDENEERSYWDRMVEGGRIMVSSMMQPTSLIGDPIFASDDAPFSLQAGLPSLNIHFMSSTTKTSSLEFPTKNTKQDTVDNYISSIDPNLRYLHTCSKMLAFSARYLADTLVLPFDFEAYAKQLITGIRALENNPILANQTLKSDQNLTLAGLRKAIDDFGWHAQNWTKNVNETIHSGNPMAIRMLNDQIMEVDRIFVIPDVPFQNGSRSAVFSAGRFGRNVFPGVNDILVKLQYFADTDEIRRNLLDLLRKHVSDLAVVITQAASHLKDFQFM